MYYTIYQITNLLDGKTYVGCHKTEDLDDGYMGSGKRLRYAIDKHGIENFQKDILGVFDTPEEMFHMESVLVNEEFVGRPDTYNLKEGGNGGWQHLNDGSQEHRNRAKRGYDSVPNLSKLGTDAIRFKWDNDPEYADTQRRRFSEMARGNKYWLGKSHTEESKRKIGEANSERQRGSGNSQYGTCWIYHPELRENKKIDKDLLGEYTRQGWIKGRKQRFNSL